MYTLEQESYYDPRIEVRESIISGKGSFARSPIKAGEQVIRWGGLVVTEKERDEIGFKPESSVHFDETHFLIDPPDAEETPDAYLNHSCDSNLWFTDGWCFTARRDISAGEELTFDYATGETYALQGACRCGSKDCRGIISGQEYKNEDFQKRYAGHFAPYIQGLIDKERKR